MQHYSAREGLAKFNRKLGVTTARKRFMRNFQKVAAAIFIPLLLGSAVTIAVLNEKIPQPTDSWYTVETLPGQKSILDLPDGTRVWLNSDTRISYPVDFLSDNRNIKLQGEAFFDVAHDKKRPFVVGLDDLRIQVLGTEFNVSNYSDESENRIFLKSGSIELRSTANNSDRLLYRMKPGERASYNMNLGKLTIGSDQNGLCMAWMEGKLVFREASIATVVSKLNRWFNVDIQVVDQEILDYTYTATFKHESLEQILELLKRSAPIEYKIIERTKQEDDIFNKTRVELYAP